MKRRSAVTVVVMALVFLGASSLYAQDTELTLEGLAKQLAAIAERVTHGTAAQDELATRVAAVETAIAPTPTPTPTATPTPGPAVSKLSMEEMEDDYFNNIFAAVKKYAEYEGKVVELEASILDIGYDFSGEELPFILVGLGPPVVCILVEIAEDELLDLRSGDDVIARGTVTLLEQDDPGLFLVMENCEIVAPDDAEGASK